MSGGGRGLLIRHNRNRSSFLNPSFQKGNIINIKAVNAYIFEYTHVLLRKRKFTFASVNRFWLI